jgi:hypothetical protein
MFVHYFDFQWNNVFDSYNIDFFLLVTMKQLEKK